MKYALFSIVSAIFASHGFPLHFSESFLRGRHYSSFDYHIHRNVYSCSRICGKNNAVENDLSGLIGSITNRGGRKGLENDSLYGKIEELIAKLETFQTSSDSFKLIDGCWKLVYTSTPGTNSPIQRTFTALDSVSIFQVVNAFNTSGSFLQDKEGQSLPDVSNTVCFFIGNSTSPVARLRVTALASTLERPLVTPRQGDGKIFGLNIFGISKSSPPRRPEERVDFAFQEARFEFRDFPFTIPYPVPFKLLGDEAKGWIDNTYVSDSIRIARGNKGTLFVLQRVDPSKDPSAAFAVSKLKKEKKGQQGKAQSRKIQRVAIIFPAQLATAEDYSELSDIIERTSNNDIRCYAAPITRFEWPVGLLPSFFSKEYFLGKLKPVDTLGFYLKKVDEAVELALSEHSDKDVELILIGHSIGGWVARAWLSEWSQPALRAKVRQLITLGSPHNPPPQDSVFANFDQTRGLLSHINEKYPGAFEPQVRYASVIGSQIRGDLNPFKIEDIVAFFSYLFLCGDGQASGDGIIPVGTSQLPGAKDIVIDDVRHSNFVPTPQKSFKLPVKWYGSVEIVEKWIGSLNS